MPRCFTPPGFSLSRNDQIFFTFSKIGDEYNSMTILKNSPQAI